MTNHNFDGEKLSEVFFLVGFVRFNNFWTIGPIVGIGPRTIADAKLRGGPKVVSPSGLWSRVMLRTDSRKSTIFSITNEYQTEEGNSYYLNFSPGVEFNFGSRMHFEIAPTIGNEFRPYQYIDAFDDETAVKMHGTRYILGQMERKTFASEFRVDYTFTPQLSLQAYLQPYITTAAYSRFKEFAEPESYDFIEYGKTPGMEIESDGVDGYYLHPNRSGNDHFYLENPDFNYKALISSFVLRWEFKPGSTLYFVWTRNGIDESNPGEFNLNRNTKDLLSAKADNVFAIKLSYWFGK